MRRRLKRAGETGHCIELPCDGRSVTKDAMEGLAGFVPRAGIRTVLEEGNSLIASASMSEALQCGDHGIGQARRSLMS
jgi:hypothetical protein